tara:strand:- start:7816 stop:8082 length:267 start_codon:yes stop_codon:yes gene_type:complete
MDIDEDTHIIEDDGFIAIQTIMDEISCLTQDNHQLFYLYKQFNLKFFNEEEKTSLDNIINTLKRKEVKVNMKNVNKLQVVDLGTNDPL